MSEHIVHTGILEDSFAVAQLLPQVPGSFKAVMRKHRAFGQLGSITVAGDSFSFRLLEEYRPLWDTRDELLEAKLAFVLGWVTHRACDRTMKPIWNIAEITGRGSDADPRVSPTECSVYHEGTLFNLYYRDDPTFRLAVFPEELAAHSGAEFFDLKQAAGYVQSAFAVNMMNIQTFCPEASDLDGQAFFENVCTQAQKFYVDVSRYTKAAGQPDAEKLEKFVTGINWYDETDPVIAAAKKLRGGEAVTPAECVAAFDAPASSHYGKALLLSLSYIIAAADYFTEPMMTMETLKARLDIGKKGPGGLGV
jgi:hypothetical protein